MALSSNKGNDWVELIFRVHPFALDALGAFLFDLGCTGLVTEQEDHKLKAYLPLPADLDSLRGRVEIYLKSLKDLSPAIPKVEWSLQTLQKEDWSRTWRRFFRPDRITPGLMILPAWEESAPPFKGRVIRMDPGPAFGTGQHPSTRMCLQAMEELSLAGPWTMLDVGTGSGILAAYGALLGAERVLALDMDEEALRWAKKNIRLNDLTDAVLLSTKPVEALKGTFSLLAANLFLKEILRLLPHLTRLLKPGGWLILSGMLRGQVHEVKEALGSLPYEAVRPLFQKEWACTVSRKKMGLDS